ncbi:MAG: DNA starvation/stationary phase protection protein Dps [Bdellovibrionales bacterium]|nr:DNA starvation/stationary phase protection protein Dps [Bdellovibrionales bacterium]
MYSTKNTLPEKTRSRINDLLQGHLANSLDLGAQAKQAHWNVKGPDFIALHELFDKIAEDTEKYIDLIAERIVQLGGIAEGTLRIASKRTQLPDYPLNISAGLDHVNALATSLAAYGEGIREAIEDADKLEDRDTADLLTQVSREVDKYLWFVEAHLQGPRSERKDLANPGVNHSRPVATT